MWIDNVNVLIIMIKKNIEDYLEKAQIYLTIYRNKPYVFESLSFLSFMSPTDLKKIT